MLLPVEETELARLLGMAVGSALGRTVMLEGVAPLLLLLSVAHHTPSAGEECTAGRLAVARDGRRSLEFAAATALAGSRAASPAASKDAEQRILSSDMERMPVWQGESLPSASAVERRSWWEDGKHEGG